MRKLLASAAAVLGLVAMEARADVLTFDEVESSQTIYTSLATGGFMCSSGHFHAFGPGRLYDHEFVQNGTTFIGYEAGRGHPIVLSRTDGAAFDLLSLDAAEFYAYANPNRPNADLLRITGYTSEGGTVTTNFALDGLYDGIDGVVDFQHFVLPTAFSNLLSIEIAGFLIDGRDGGVSVDNIEYTLSTVHSVPEPGSLALFGLAGVSVAWVRRRRRR